MQQVADLDSDAGDSVAMQPVADFDSDAGDSVAMDIVDETAGSAVPSVVKPEPIFDIKSGCMVIL
jgi:hypothetical protein